MRELVVDDDPELAERVCTSLARDGHRVCVAPDLAGARVALNEEVDLLVLDLGLPEGSGLEVCLGRRRKNPPLAVHEVGGVRLEGSRLRAQRDGAEDELTTREWGILELLAARGGRVVSRDAILDEVWGESTEGAAASLEVLVGWIRRKLGRELIRTVRGVGDALG